MGSGEFRARCPATGHHEARRGWVPAGFVVGRGRDPGPDRVSVRSQVPTVRRRPFGALFECAPRHRQVGHTTKPPGEPAASSESACVGSPGDPVRQGTIRWTGLPLIWTFQVVTSFEVPDPVMLYLIFHQPLCWAL